jgi:hypothetical protein
MEDLRLLRQYAEHRSERAFAELVDRHKDLVYSTALRLVGESQLAQDVGGASKMARCSLTKGSLMRLSRTSRKRANE